ncbi:hypothetical protein, partial [Microcoleus sp. CAWBG640]|uniref:hypothetical protein n=1 Tax=Microcoleus sp. CAWBG640 TaxID=2841653 RepID=UPI00312B44E2
RTRRAGCAVESDMASLITVVWFHSYHCRGFDASRQNTNIISNFCYTTFCLGKQPASIWSIELL